MQCCGTPFPTCEEEPPYNVHVFWWQLLENQENQNFCLQILHAAMFQVLRGAYILLRVLVVTESQKAQGLLDEIREDKTRKP